MKRYSLCFGRQLGYVHPHPERTAKKSGNGVFSDDIFQIWPNRASMAKSIRMQQSGPPRHDHWRALVPLTDTEGF